ncbi:hypothetical protein S7335_3480 [Synechococcus sp. PCC 7335]|nr:hypothetical protein S7335_3480 [Synechococcus sp. PCC 7335]
MYWLRDVTLSICQSTLMMTRLLKFLHPELYPERVSCYQHFFLRFLLIRTYAIPGKGSF